MKRKFNPIILLPVIAILIFIVLKLFYFVGSMNIHEYNNIIRYLDYYYPNNEFTVEDKSYSCLKTEDNNYIHLYKMELSDGEIEFCAIQCFISSKRFEGSFIDDDYKTSISDNYTRNSLKNSVILKKYENDFEDAVINKKPDYVFILDDNNEKEIIEAIAIILESKPTNNNALDVWLEVQDENLNVLCDGRDIIEYCNENRSTEKETQELVGEYIKGLIER